MFGPRQVGEVIVGKKFLPAVKDFKTFKTSADGDIAMVSSGRGAEFKFVQKTDGEVVKNLDYEFSDIIDPKYIEKITVAKYKPEVMSVWEIAGFDNSDAIKPMRTYELSIQVQEDLSPQNYDIIFGYYTTGEVLGSDNKDTILAGLIKNININLMHRGNFEFTVTKDVDKIKIVEKYQPNILGKKDGRKLIFRCYAKVFNNISTGYNGDLGYLKATNTVKPYVGNGTGKRVTNYEWFCKGYKYDPNREYAYPINFTYPMYSHKDGEYDTVQVIYYTPRTETTVERQYKVLSVFVDKGNTQDLVDALAVIAEKAGALFITDIPVTE